MLPYIQDVAFQAWVLQQAYPHQTVSTFLMMPDKSKIVTVDGLNQMFKIKKFSKKIIVESRFPKNIDVRQVGLDILEKVNVDQYVKKVLDHPIVYSGGIKYLAEIVPIWAQAYKNDLKISPVIGANCDGCQFKSDPQGKLKNGFAECWTEITCLKDGDFKLGTILDLWNFRGKQKLIEQGIFRTSNKKTFSACESKSNSTPVTGRLHASPRVFHIGRASGGTDAARRWCARPPSAACPDRYHGAAVAMPTRS